MLSDFFPPVVGSFLAPSYDLVTVGLSVLIAILASFVTLGLARRVHMATGHMGHVWWLVGSMVMGTGIWSTHFIGMQAYQLPITLGYGGAMTLASWAAAVAASAIAFGVAARDQYRWPQFLLASLAMGGGICAMHYQGMLALEMSLPIHRDWRLITVSALIAVLALAAALNLFRFLFTLSGKRLWLMQALAAVVMGAAICGLHYTGMSATSYASGSVCLSAGALNGP